MTRARNALLALAFAACSRPVTPPESAPPPAPPSPATTPAAGASNNARCERVRLAEGFTCVPSPGGGAIVLTRDAAATADPCPSAECPANTRCESSPQALGERTYRLPRCVATAPGAAPPGLQRDPCASYACPTAYHCTAPADAPYCVPDQGDW